MSRVKKRIWNTVCIIVLVLLVSVVVSKVMLGWGSVFSYRLFFIMSNSMEPVISEHQFVIGKLISDVDEVEVGEIYAYRKDALIGKKIVIHRLLEVVEGKYRFKGDNNEAVDDELVDRSDIGFKIIWK